MTEVFQSKKDAFEKSQQKTLYAVPKRKEIDCKILQISRDLQNFCVEENFLQNYKKIYSKSYSTTQNSL